WPMMGAGGMGWMWVIWPVVLIGLLLVVVLLLRGRGNTPERNTRPTSRASETEGTRARELLDERYARGEVSDEEYEEKRKNLRGSTGR
ncbi:MAG: SHOCT domain-containing protein, partial [Ornithinimicrobium sp.]